MSRIGTLARRTFLVGSVAIAGGVAFGIYRYRTPYANPLLENLPEGEAAITPYVRIDAEGVTLITPRADKGQGVYSVQAALIAEELDIELDQIGVDPGPPSPAYWNTALSEEAAAFVAPGGGLMNAAAHGAFDAMIKFLGMQVTGGSTTVPDGFVKLRRAGASARETLKLAAANRTGIAPVDLRTEAGAVLLPDGTRISYSALAPDAAGLDPVQDVPLRDPSEWRLIGQPMQRLDILPKSTGTLIYGIDCAVAGMLHATVLLNPAQTGPINGFDASAAEAMRGVRAVVPVTGGVGIVADNTWRAFQAAGAVQADWGPAPFPATMAAHWDSLAAAFTKEFQDSRNRDDGDVEAALAAGQVIEAEYRAPYLAHAPLEPISAIVQVNADSVEVWTGTQIPRFIQTNISALTGIDAENIHVHVLYMGGSFGHRLEDEVVKQATEIAMQMPGIPIKLTYSREEDMTHDFTRQIAMARMRGTVRDGQVESYDLGIAMPSVIGSQMARQGLSPPGPDSQIVAGAWDQAFAIPNHRVTGYRAPDLAPLSSWRSVGASSNGFFYNTGLDELIHAAGADPMEERLRLCNDDLARATLEAVRDMSGWTGADMGENRGRGVALTQSFGVQCAEVVEVTNTDRGIRIDTVYVAAEVGTVVDPINFENLVQGGVVWALGHAMNCEITYRDGIAEQDNYHAYEGMRLYQCPRIIVQGLENGDPVRGIGEPPVPPAAAALSGAIFAATGQRLREMPFNRFIDFV
ncbi:xanthine dehydrogenase family protein molybdopterin-binding subunit [Rhodophyticola sp. CCM32]|uniref:xanthine dehydrogenase family protein molybdopterin-binding subunit n=1 Tax=Rhodophyticola sp. CCM32 TaxID=2916397 RepID=UPI00107F9315|nr:molybdopterin cofactor-binding domain-containing protein [Rhodophyticola sp. CCM32]QBY00491.1 xanthine dehydrogenase family protein molybdopterin-binding subunit [Rhodophyticola sp. CCM32]